MQKIRTYSELIKIPTFQERYEYLKLDGRVGLDTFGSRRWVYQDFLQSVEWKRIRNYVIIRDKACDLASADREITNNSRILIHHLNPVKIEDVINRSPYLLDPEFMVCTIKSTHNAIHYGDSSILILEPVIRQANDTCPWKMSKEN